MTKINSIFFVAAALTLFSFTVAFPQNSSSAAEGLVVGQISERTSGQPVAGATVKIKNRSETTTSDANGNFRLGIENGVFPRFSITPGARLDRYGITGEILVSPRFSARFGTTSKIALTFATGIYRQPPSLFVLALAPNNRNLKTQTATHFIGGVEWLARGFARPF